MRLAVILCCLLLAGGTAAAARADTAPYADSGLPWADPAHRSPLEVLGGAIASTIAKRTVFVRCQGENDWRILAEQAGFEPGSVLGYVRSLWTASGALHSISDSTELSPKACLALHEFAVAPLKPTKCAAPTSVTVTTNQIVSERVRVRVPVVKLVRGKRVRTTALRWRTVRKTVPVQKTTTVPGTPAACFANDVRANADDGAYWERYQDYVLGLQTLAHEAIHLSGIVGGTLRSGLQVGYVDDEARADCWGMQWLAYVAQQLGAAPDDAQAIARFYALNMYPQWQRSAPEYWSAECRDGGALDLRPESSLWP